MSNENIDRISISDFWQCLLTNKKIFIFSISIPMIIGLWIAFSLPKIYQSNIVVYPVTNAFSYNKKLKKLDWNKKVSSLETIFIELDILQSRKFLGEFLSGRNVSKLLSDNNMGNNKFFKKNYQNANSLEQRIKKFKEFNLFVDRNIENNMITIGIRSYSPRIAKKLSTLIVQKMNRYLRDMATSDTREEIIILNKKYRNTELPVIKEVILPIILREKIKLAILNNNIHSFKIVDPAIIPEKKIGPLRLWIIMLYFGLGMFTYILILNIKLGIVLNPWDLN